MTLAMELQRQKKAGLEEGCAEEKNLTALEILRSGRSIEMLSKCTLLSIVYTIELGKNHRLV